MPRLAVITLLVAIAARIICTLFPSVHRHMPGVNAYYHASIKVTMACSPGTPWKDTVHELLRSAFDRMSMTVCVLLECDRIEDAVLHHGDSSGGGSVYVTHATRPSSLCPLRRMRRVFRKCVKGDETLVINVDPAIRLEDNWDVTIMQLVKAAPKRSVLCAPAVSAKDEPCFPTLVKSKGSGLVHRGPSRAMAQRRGMQEDVGVVEGVCFCSELCVFTQSALDDIAVDTTQSPVAQTRAMQAREYAVVVPTVPLVKYDVHLFEEVTLRDAGHTDPALHKHELTGMSRDPTDLEKIVKFGSCRIANLTARFVEP